MKANFAQTRVAVVVVVMRVKEGVITRQWQAQYGYGSTAYPMT
jgi:uncharacterized protein (DUF433 family)